MLAEVRNYVSQMRTLSVNIVSRVSTRELHCELHSVLQNHLFDTFQQLNYIGTWFMLLKYALRVALSPIIAPLVQID